MNIVAHNMIAMNASRQYQINTKSKAKSTEKLSSGYKINRASDDAAGLSISEKMRRQIRGLSQGTENTQDGVSLCQVADGALAEVNDMLHRITELSVQSANGTNTDSDREAIQDEISQILSEIERISDTTTFNTMKLFDGKQDNVLKTPLDFVNDIQSSFSISGTPSGISVGNYSLTASNTGIIFNGNSISWTDIKDSTGNSFNTLDIENNIFSFSSNGISFSFQTENGATLQNVIDAIDQTTFSVDSKSISYNKVSITDYGVTPGTDTENFLTHQRTYHNYNGGYKITADETGIGLEGYPVVSWASMGIDINNANGKSFTFSDSTSGAYFSATIANDASKEEILSSFSNSRFYWGNIDSSTTENARLGFSAESVTTTITNDSSAPVKPNRVNVTKIYDGLFNNLGYTSQADKLNPLNLSLSISGTDHSDLIVTFHAENGNTLNLPVSSWDPPIYHYANPSGRACIKFSYADNALVSLQMSYSTLNVPNDADAYSYLGTLGTIATDIIVPSPIYFKYNTNSLTKTELSAKGLAFKDKSDLYPDDISKKPHEFWIQSGAEAGSGMFLEIDKMNTSILGINALDVSTEAGANDALDKVPKALEKLMESRSKIGAQQNRLEHTIANNENAVENTTDAESRIRDTDMAEEMVKFSKDNILSMVGESMLAQANQSNQGVLSLLQ